MRRDPCLSTLSDFLPSTIGHPKSSNTNRAMRLTLICLLICLGTMAFQPSISSTRQQLRADSPSVKLMISPAEAWGAYNEALEANPLLVKSVTAGVILGAADLAGQALEKSRKSSVEKDEEEGIDVARAVRFAVFGLVLQAPWNHFYYLLLDGKIPPTEDPFTSTNAIKVVIDQFVQGTFVQWL